MRFFVLGKTKSAMAFEVFDAGKGKQTVIPSARLPFRFRRMNEPSPLTADILNAKLRRAQENRLRELEQIRWRARNLATHAWERQQ